MIIYTKIQREINKIMFLGQIASSFDDIGNSSAIVRTALYYTDAKEKVQKLKKLIKTGNVIRILLDMPQA